MTQQQHFNKRQQNNNNNNRTTTPLPKNINPKLLHILRKIVKTTPPSQHSLLNLYEILIKNHKEYSRRNQIQLEAEIQLTLNYITSTSSSSSSSSTVSNDSDGGSGNDSSGREKRKRRQSSGEDDSYDRAARRDDQSRENLTCNLNNSLTSNYIKKNLVSEQPPPTPTKKKKKKKLKTPTTKTPTTITPTTPTQRLTDLGGITPLLTTLHELIHLPLHHPHLFTHLGATPPRGILLIGPSGTGKTHLAHALAGSFRVNFLKTAATELIAGVSGDSEGKIRELFGMAAGMVPCLLFLDDVDVICAARKEGGMEKRMVSQLGTCLDECPPGVVVIAATNRVEVVDGSLRRAGRFDRELRLGVPDEDSRRDILAIVTKDMKVEDGVNLRELAKMTPGYVGADLKSLACEAAVVAIKRVVSPGGGDDPWDVPGTIEDLSSLFLTTTDFQSALKRVQPTSQREGFATVPDVTWNDVGALKSIREELSLTVLEPISHPERFHALGLPLPSGVMLYGPPGCGKTLLAKAIANESGANFISVKGPELLDKYVGESERAVRRVFERARSSAPCVVFFDELDSLCPRRGSDSGGGNVSERVVNQLLTEMDGLEERRSVFVIAATNRPELIDPAMMRPGRLDKLLYVPLPTPSDRASILHALSKNISLSPTVDLATIAHDPRADGYSGADCAALLREAGLAVLRDKCGSAQGAGGGRVVGRVVGEERLEIDVGHFGYAFEHVVPSVSKRDQMRYERMRDKMARARTRGGLMASAVGDDGGSVTKDGGGDVAGERGGEGEMMAV